MDTSELQVGTFPAQSALLDLNRGPTQLSVHYWTLTGTFPAQIALPLDLNLEPAQLSVHH